MTIFRLKFFRLQNKTSPVSILGSGHSTTGPERSRLDLRLGVIPRINQWLPWRGGRHRGSVRAKLQPASAPLFSGHEGPAIGAKAAHQFLEIGKNLKKQNEREHDRNIGP
jgi:hypothetical protein